MNVRTPADVNVHMCLRDRGKESTRVKVNE